jgi:hypothetical protein
MATDSAIKYIAHNSRKPHIYHNFKKNYANGDAFKFNSGEHHDANLSHLNKVVQLYKPRQNVVTHNLHSLKGGDIHSFNSCLNDMKLNDVPLDEQLKILNKFNSSNQCHHPHKRIHNGDLIKECDCLI